MIQKAILVFSFLSFFNTKNDCKLALYMDGNDYVISTINDKESGSLKKNMITKNELILSNNTAFNKTTYLTYPTRDYSFCTYTVNDTCGINFNCWSTDSVIRNRKTTEYKVYRLNIEKNYLKIDSLGVNIDTLQLDDNLIFNLNKYFYRNK